MATETIRSSTFDTAKSEAFADKLIGMLNGGALSVMTSIGHRTGLFDAMKGQPPATSGEVAATAKLDARYVREWLDAMVTGGFVDYDPATAQYVLPDEHAAWLTRAASPDNIAVVAQYVGMMGTVEDRIVECFRNGGGVPYSGFDRFHEIMAEDSGQTVLAGLFDHILPLVLGLDDRLQKGIDVVDVGCGRGRALLLMAERYPNSRFTGLDLSADAVANANAEVERRGLSNVRFEVCDLPTWTAENAYDLVTAFDVIHDQAKPAKVLSVIRRALRPDGVFLMQDIAGSSHVHKNMNHPLGPFMYTVSCTHCMTVSLAQGGEGLGTMWGEERAAKMLGEAGFTSVDIQKLPHDMQNAYFVCRS